MSLWLNNILSILGLIFLCVLCFIIGRWEGNQKVVTEIRLDTLTIEKPIPYKVEKVRTEYVYVHAPADTIVKEVVRVDSVFVAVDIERRVYGDERYRAVVSGAVVGNIHPTLDEIDIYSRNETRIVEHKAPMFRPYLRGSVGRELIGIGGGVSIKDRVDIDVQYMRFRNDNMVVFGANYRFNIKSK